MKSLYCTNQIKKMTKHRKKYLLSSISCILTNTNDDGVLQRGNITQKNKTKELPTKYVPPHLRKTNEIKVPRKEHGKR